MRQPRFSDVDLTNLERATLAPAEQSANAEPESAPEPHSGYCAGRPRAGDLEARMQNLVATAARLFVEKGYSKVSLELIAREAHVAVRTIYVKFGGKSGLFKAVIAEKRDRFFSDMGDMDTDMRPIDLILADFGEHYLELVATPYAISMQRMVMAEAKSSPELASAFYQAGPAQTRESLARFFARPDIRAQFRDTVPVELLPTHLINCLMGDHIKRFLFDQESEGKADIRRAVSEGLSLFFYGTLASAYKN